MKNNNTHGYINFAALLFFLFSSLLYTPNLLQAESMRNIEKKGDFEICVAPDAMPLSYFDPDNPAKPTGIQIDIGKEISKRLKVDLKVSWLSYRYHAKYTTCDAFLGIGRLKGEADNPYLKKTIPFFKIEILLATRPDLELKDIKDMNGKRVAVDNGSLVHDSLRKKSEAEIFVGYLTDEKKLLALQNNEVDVALITNLGLGWFIKNHPEAKFKAVSSKIVSGTYEYDYAFGLRKADRMTVRDFNDMISSMIDDGTLNSIFENYGVKYQVNRWEGEFIR